MKEFFTSVHHQTAVRLLGTRNLYLRTVYCHVLGYTQAHGSWQGTHLEMAHQLELSKSQITRCLNELIRSGLVYKQGSSTYIAVGAECVLHGAQGAAGGAQGAESDVIGTPSGADSTSPDNPLYTNNIIRETRTHPRDAPATTNGSPSFPDFCNAYRSIGGKITAQQHTACYDLWCRMPPVKRQAVMDELSKPDGFRRPRPDWLLSDYQLPPPKNYNRSSEFDSAVKTIPLVSASYNGDYGIYSLTDARKYGMQIKCGMNFRYDTTSKHTSE